MRGWILLMVMTLGVSTPALGSARECRAGQPVPDRYPNSVATAPTALQQQAHAVACQHLEQRDQHLRPWVKPVQKTVGVVLWSAALLCALALFRQWCWGHRAHARVYALVALHALSALMLLGVALAVYRGVARGNLRGPPRWLWYELSPVAFSVQQCIQVALAIGMVALGWVMLKPGRPPRSSNPLPRRGARRGPPRRR
ncbi:hypothetical protein KQ945_06640 [Bacillus subtilis subsp. subtilis]|nr:hypothetical protein [Bacillus subtilis subsp. subtilis]